MHTPTPTTTHNTPTHTHPHTRTHTCTHARMHAHAWLLAFRIAELEERLLSTAREARLVMSAEDISNISRKAHEQWISLKTKYSMEGTSPSRPLKGILKKPKEQKEQAHASVPAAAAAVAGGGAWDISTGGAGASRERGEGMGVVAGRGEGGMGGVGALRAGSGAAGAAGGRAGWPGAAPGGRMTRARAAMAPSAIPTETLPRPTPSAQKKVTFLKQFMEESDDDEEGPEARNSTKWARENGRTTPHAPSGGVHSPLPVRMRALDELAASPPIG